MDKVIDLKNKIIKKLDSNKALDIVTIELYEDSEIDIILSADDPEGDELTYSWFVLHILGISYISSIFQP